MSEDSEGVFVPRIVILNFTTSPMNTTQGEDVYVSEHIRLFITLTRSWLKVIPDIIYATGLFANILLATYLIKYKRYRSPIFCLILSMCFADTMMCAIGIFWTTVRVPFLIGPVWFCPFSVEFLYSSILTSEYHLVVISVVRFYQLVFPLSARAKITTGLIAKLCIAVWILSFASNIPFAIFTGVRYVEYEGNMYGMCSWVRGEPVLRYLFIVTVNVIAPFVITAVFHIAKHCIVLKSGAMSDSSMTKDEQKRETTDTRAVMIVITVYLVTAAPITVLNILYAVGVNIDPFFSDIANKVLWMNSTLNPFIYAFAAQSVRRDVVRMIRLPQTSRNNTT